MSERRYSITEMAEALGVSKNAVRRRANRAAWPYVEGTTRGGRRRMYAVSDLPRLIVIKMAGRDAVKASKAAAIDLSERLIVVVDRDVFEMRRLPS